MKKRIYAVTNVDGGTRLISAANKTQAVNHVAKSQFRVGLADQRALVELLTKGVAVEEAVPEQLEAEV